MPHSTVRYLAVQVLRPADGQVTRPTSLTELELRLPASRLSGMGEQPTGAWMAPLEQQHPRILYGRERELAETDAALEASASGRPRSLVVGGDAGIGKTSLVAEVSSRARDRGFTVLVGHCLDIETGVPLDPVREALRGSVSGRLDHQLPQVSRRLAPFLGVEAPSTVDTSTTVTDDLRLAVAELAREAPVALVLEDMHWSDRSTQDFALALARTMQGRMLLVLTYRAEALTRGHPFRRALVEIDRAEGARHLDLKPLGHGVMAELVRARAGDLDESVVRAVVDRSEGNPLYAEELLADRSEGVPRALKDLLLARIDALTPSTRALMRLVSVNGSRIDPTLLAQAADLPPTDVERCLHEAIDANVVTHASDRLGFRHGLLREAAYDDLLPDERARAHAEMADALESRFAAGTGEPSFAAQGQLAFHRYAAHQIPQAFAASVRAGLASRWYGAREAIDHLERALELWDEVPDPDTLGGIAKPDLLRLLAETTEGHGEFDRADRYIFAALAALDGESDPLLASRVYATYGSYYKEFREGLDQRKALEMAVAYAEGRPSEELAKSLTALGRWQYGRSPMSPVLELAARAVEVAEAADCPPELVEALWLLGRSQYFAGRCEEGIGWMRQAIDVAEAAGLTGFALEVQGELSVHVTDFGMVEQGRALAEEAHARALACGLTTAATFNGEQVVEGLRSAGRLDEAERLLDQLRSEGIQPYRWEFLQADQLLARGELETALTVERGTMARAESGVDEHMVDVVRQVDLFGALGRIEEVLPIVDRHLEQRLRTGSPLILAVAARSGYAALASAAGAGVVPPDALAGRAAEALRQAMLAMSDGWSSSVHAAHGLLAVAMARTLDGDPAVDEWRAAVRSAAPHGDYFVLRPRLGLAGALFAAGERDEGRELVLGLWQSAREMGAGWFEREAARLARRNRVPIPEDDRLPRPLAMLTPREREVLDILTTGATNRVIAERLFVTEKTASVHVTNILAKLGVSNRGEAAALARTLLDSD